MPTFLGMDSFLNTGCAEDIFDLIVRGVAPGRSIVPALNNYSDRHSGRPDFEPFADKETPEFRVSLWTLATS
jgi:hypothetical protein